MPVPAENEWDIVDPATRTNTMESTDSIAPAAAPADAPGSTTPTPKPAAAPTIELTINATKPKPEEKKDADECTCGASKPRLVRQDSFDSDNSADDLDYRRPRRVRPNYPRRYSISPVRIRRANSRERTTLLGSSTQLLDKAGKYDGLADLPFPARGSVYLSTFPFTEKDVKKWAWLFSLGVEDVFLAESGRGRAGGGIDTDDDNDDAAFPTVRQVRRGRDRSPYYDPGNVDIPSVHLSRALDTDVVPETTTDACYLIVTQNRHRPAGSKLQIAESRKAAGMLMYYEVLRGDSIMFVGAMANRPKKTVHPKKFRKVETVEEAAKLSEEGFVGVIC